MDAASAGHEPGGELQPELDLEPAAPDGGGVENGAPRFGDDQVAGFVVGDGEAFLEDEFDLGLLGNEVNFAEIRVDAQPAGDGGNAGHARGGSAESGQRLRSGGDTLADGNGGLRGIGGGATAGFSET